MENEVSSLSTLIYDSFNTLISQFISSIDNSLSSNLDSIFFINSDFLNDTYFQKFFGTDITNGLLLIANSLIFGLILFYVFRFALSHLTYSKIDSPFQFIFKCIIFIACMNSSLWICEKILDFAALISETICEIGMSITGHEISFSSFVNYTNSVLFPDLEYFNILSFDGFIKLFSSIYMIYILICFSIRYILCKICILFAPFAFMSLINNHFDGIFRGWFKGLLILISMQILVSAILILGFTLDSFIDNTLSQLIYIAILITISKSNYYIKYLFSYIYDYSHNSIKNFN